MAALLVGMSVMAVLLSVALPVWHTAAQREREAELVFRGEQYARAVMLFQRKYGGAFPPSLDVLLDQRFLRKKYKDPMTDDGEFQPLFAGQSVGQPGAPGGSAPFGTQAGQMAAPQSQPPAGRIAGAAPTGGVQAGIAGVQAGIMGVVSKSKATSLRVYNGRTRYDEWAFVATQATTQAGAPTGAQRPGQPGRGGRGTQPSQPGRGGPGVQPGPGPGRGPGGRGGFPEPGSSFPPFRGSAPSQPAPRPGL